MKKQAIQTAIIGAITITASIYLLACKKEAKEQPKTTTTYYIKVIEVDMDNTTLTETPYIKVKITE